MSEQRRCIRCERAIDPYARICPYCNQDQNEPVPAAPTPVAGAPVYVPPAERNWRKQIIWAIGGVVLLIGAFAVGALVHGNDPPKDAPEPITAEQQAAAANVRPAPRSDVTLVPVGEGGMDAPITSAPVTNPAEGVPTEYQRSDATAVSSVEYVQLAKRADDEKKKMKAMVDPRSITGPAYAQAPVRPEPSTVQPPMMSGGETSSADGDTPATAPTREPARIIVSTRPVPQYQPIPDISVAQTTVARLELVIGADGRVKDVRIINGIPGQTAKLISTVQSWKFKPATENGTPVSAPFSVDISFRGND